jgi:hypothetical protein
MCLWCDWGPKEYDNCFCGLLIDIPVLMQFVFMYGKSNEKRDGTKGVCLCRVPIQLQMLWAVSHGRNSMMVQMCQNQLMACKLSRRRQMNNM